MLGFLRPKCCLLGIPVVLLLAACHSTPINHAPVEDRTSVPAKVDTDVHPVVAAPVKPPPGSENAGRPGYYTVKPKDTLIGIGLETGQSHKDIARWNNIENPNRIEIGQVLRVVPPTAGDSVAVAKPVTTGAAAATPIAAGTASRPASTPASAVASTAASSAVATTSAPSTPTAGAVSAGSEDELGWIWPGGGPVLAGFDEAKNKGVDIGGAAGDAVVASSDGKVVYAGAGLRGYGNLIILKHNNTFLTAYAHNQTLLVKEDQTVKKGQKIAEMGNSDSDRVKLHFEVRRQGKPVDPLKYLPNR